MYAGMKSLQLLPHQCQKRITPCNKRKHIIKTLDNRATTRIPMTIHKTQITHNRYPIAEESDYVTVCSFDSIVKQKYQSSSMVGEGGEAA